MRDYDDTPEISPLRQAAGGTAIVTGVFGVFIAALLALHLYHYVVTDPARTDELEQLKEQYTREPTNAQLAERIYELDIQTRRDQFARLYFLQRGTLLLVIDLAVFVAAVLVRTRHWRTPALPDAAGDRKTEQIRHALHVRTAVTLTAVVLAGGGLYLAQHPFETPPPPAASDAADPQPAEPVYASFEDTLAQWPAFRGPQGLGVTELDTIPDDWDGPSGRNILWKSSVPLEGHNSPVIWEDRVFLSGATDQQQQIFCYDLNSGQLLWAGDVAIADDPDRENMYIMEDTGYAAPTVVTDGYRVAAIFAGGDVGCFTVEGERLWHRHLGVPESAYGYAASLTAYEQNIIVQYDVSYEAGQSRLIALDWQTGRIVWQTPRPVPNSWSSPTVVQVGETPQLLTSGSPWVIAYDPTAGTELYRVDALSGDVAPTQVFADNKILAIEPYNSIVAIRTEEADGDVTDTHLAWRSPADIPDITSPVSVGTLVWTLSTYGTLIAFDLSDGSEVYSERLDFEFQASPSIVNDRLYLLSVRGTMILAETGRQYREIKQLELGEKCYATPAFAPGRIVIRGINHLYCIGTAP